jgi:hypothetical protein
VEGTDCKSALAGADFAGVVFSLARICNPCLTIRRWHGLQIRASKFGFAIRASEDGFIYAGADLQSVPHKTLKI